MPAVTLPTATDGEPPSPLDLAARQTRTAFVVIPAHYSNLHNSLHPGIIAGIVLGSVAGFLLLIWFCYCALGFGPRIIEEELVVRPKHRHHHHRRRQRSYSRGGARPNVRVTERVEVRSRERERERERPSGGVEPVVVEPPGPSEEEDDEEVVVIEEHEPPPRRNKKTRMRGSGYRDLDPDRFAGGDAPMREVPRHGRRSRDS